MKKLFVCMVAIAAIICFTMNVYAANNVETKLTSRNIIKKNCELMGSVSFTFDAGTIITQGDEWYFDLPVGATICKDIDYFLVGDGANATAAAGTNPITAIDETNLVVTLAAGVNGIATGLAAHAGVDEYGPFTKSTTLNVAATWPSVVDDDVVIRVHTEINNNNRRVWFTVYGTAGGGTADAIQVNNGMTFTISVLDGKPYITNLIYDVNNNYATNSIIDTTNRPAEYVYPQDSLCANVTGITDPEKVEVSFDDLSSKYTFTTGNKEIAHVNTAPEVLQCTSAKGAVTDAYIKIASQASCLFDYEDPTGYCAFSGNRIIIANKTTGFLGSGSDFYDVSIEVTKPASGVYFGGNFALNALEPTENGCVVNGTNIAVGAWTSYSYTAGTTPNAGGSCSVSSGNMVKKVYTTNGAFYVKDKDYNALWVDLPNLIYDSSVVQAGQEVEVTVTLNNYPCTGMIYSVPVVVGSFVTTCPAIGNGAAGTAELLFPWLPAANLASWWGGVSIVNTSSTSGTIVITVYELDGDKGTYTTAAIPAGGMYNPDITNIFANLTPDSANAGTLGDQNFFIRAMCNFPDAGGMAFVANGVEGIGYTAYEKNDATWQ